MKTRPVAVEPFHAERHRAIGTDRHDKANSRFRNFAYAPQKKVGFI